jgi:protein gp37
MHRVAGTVQRQAHANDGGLNHCLEQVDLRPWLGAGRIDWIVAGGETGAKDARYMEPDWARDLLRQCRMTGTRLFLKNMWKSQQIPADLMVREFPP